MDVSVSDAMFSSLVMLVRYATAHTPRTAFHSALLDSLVASLGPWFRRCGLYALELLRRIFETHCSGQCRPFALANLEGRFVFGSEANWWTQRRLFDVLPLISLKKVEAQVLTSIHVE